MTLDEATRGKIIPRDIRETLTIVDLPYLSFDGKNMVGQMVIHKEVAQDVIDVFAELLARRFPVMRMFPTVIYDWDDERSMEENNTSAFNYRTIMGTDRLSNHSFGVAIDINPRENPYVLSDGRVFPSGATYDIRRPGTITPEIAEIFKKRGWRWGGDWGTPKDWQHFDKTLI
jgi:peptidoglycan L-alanyl-D-glutamate endopeptidase CwlK